MGMISNNILAQEKIDAQIDVPKADIIMLKSRRNALSPVSQLPLEVLHAIYAQVEDIESKILPPPLILSHVCRSWRELVVGSPGLWADIRIKRQTSPPLLDLMLKNARRLPLQVTFKPWLTEHSPILPAVRTLLSAVERLRSLDISCSERILELLRSRGRADSLEYIRINVADTVTPLSTLCGGTPNLRHLELHGCYLPWDSPLLLQSPRLTHLILQDPTHWVKASPSQLCRVLRQVPQLQFLNFKQLLITGNEPDHSLAPIHLPNLRTLAIGGDLGGLCTFLRGIRIPMSIAGLDIAISETGDALDIDEVLFALKSALGNPTPDDFISPRRLQLLNCVTKFTQATYATIDNWGELPTLTPKPPFGLVHSSQGQAWKTFSILTCGHHSMGAALLSFFQGQAQMTFCTLADLRYLNMNVSGLQPYTWPMFAQLPNLEEVVVGIEGDYERFLKALHPVEDASDSDAQVPYPFPSLRSLVCKKPLLVGDISEFLGALELRQKLGASLEYLELPDFIFSVNPEARRRVSYFMSTVAANVVWKPWKTW